MSHSKVARLYAESLYGFAAAEKATESVNADVEVLLEVWNESSEIRRIFGNPVIKVADKYQILKSVLSGKVSGTFSKFIEFLAGKERIDAAGAIAAAYSSIRDEHENNLRVVIESAVELSPSQVLAISAQLQSRYNKNILIKQEINKELIGGFIVKLDDVVMDASLKNKLQELKKKFVNSSISLN